MIIIKAETMFGEEFFGMGETIEAALEDLAGHSEDVDFEDCTFYDSTQINVKKNVTYEILDPVGS